MQKQQIVTSAVAATLIDAVSATIAVPPLPAQLGLLPSPWQGNGVSTPGELELSVWGNGTRALTGAQLYVGALHLITFADITVTATAATDQLNAVGHLRESGDGPITMTSTLTLPGNVNAGQQYWLFKVDANNVKLAPSLNDALKGTNLVDITSTGTGTIKIAAVANATQRVFWHATGLLGPLNDGAINVDINAAYLKVIPLTVTAVAFALIATFGAGTGAVSAAVLPRYDRD